MTEEQIARALRELRCAFDPDELPDLTVSVSMRQDSIAIAIEALSKLMKDNVCENDGRKNMSQYDVGHSAEILSRRRDRDE